MNYRFTKMQGCGNDYVYIETFTQNVSDHAELAKALSDRRFGVGGDGVIYVCPSSIADAKMRIFNEDGSEAKMCGNGIRCVAKFLYDHQFVDRTDVRIDTLSGVKTIRLQLENGVVTGASVDMGAAILQPSLIPTTLDGDAVVHRAVDVAGQTFEITCVSMGNPHCVLFVDDPYAVELEKVGPLLEHAPFFPDRANIEFIRVLDGSHLQMRVWERGSGETFACGTGACAAVVAAVLNGYCEKGELITVSLRGGDLQICYTDQTVTMRGPAKTVFEGTVDIEL